MPHAANDPTSRSVGCGIKPAPEPNGNTQVQPTLPKNETPTLEAKPSRIKSPLWELEKKTVASRKPLKYGLDSGSPSVTHFAGGVLMTAVVTRCKLALAATLGFLLMALGAASLATFHPVFRGLKRVDLKLREGRLTGTLRTGSKSDDQGYDAEVLGFVEANGGKVTRFDAVARGLWWADGEQGDGTSAGLTGLPKGKKYPVAVAFTLADPSDGVARVVPYAALGVSSYPR